MSTERAAAANAAVVTIVTAAELPLAAVLAESLATHHRGQRLQVLLLDRPAPVPLPLGLPFDVLGVDELGLDDDHWHRLVTWLDPSQLQHALIPVLLRAALARGADVAVHLACDAEVHAPLDGLIAITAEDAVVLSPRTRRPPPLDGLEPTEQAIVDEGLFDLGVVAVSTAAESFMADWIDHSIGPSAVATHLALTDGLRPHRPVPFLDAAPAWWPLTVSTDPGLGVAYWNLHERAITAGGDGSLLVDGAPLRVMRFRGFDPAEPYRLSSETGDRSRISPADDEVLLGLCTDRAKRIDEWRSLGEDAPYAWDRVDGLRLDMWIRRIYGDAWATAVRDGTDLPPDPLADGASGALVEWLNEPVGGNASAPVSRYLLGLWHRRLDLHLSFPEPGGADAARFRDWAATDEAFHRESQAALLPAHTGPVVAGVVDADDVTPGVNIVGYLEAEFGLGDSARLVARAVAHTGMPLATRTIRAFTQARQQQAFRHAGGDDLPYSVNLLSIMPNELVMMAHDAAQSSALSSRLNVGLWFWEVDRLIPRIREAAALVDEVWAASAFMAHTFSSELDLPVHHFVHPLPVPPEPTHLTRADLGLPDDRFLFGFVFDFDSVLDRKNPAGLVRAYTDAFGPDDGATLVLKSVNGRRRRDDLDRLRFAIGDRRDVVIVDGYWSEVEVHAFFQLIDAFASLHRSEGLGLTMARAMGSAKPVVATGYSGNLDFMTPDNSFLVPYELVEVGEGRVPYPADATWADPDLAVASAHLRRVFDDRDHATAIGARARADLIAHHSVAAAAPFFAEQMERISRR